MSDEKVFDKKVFDDKKSTTNLIIKIVFIILFTLISPFQVNANSTTIIGSSLSKTAPLTKLDLYDELKIANNEQLLFFTDSSLNLSGLTLLSLLADLGMREDSIITSSEMGNIDLTDKALTQQLNLIASQSSGNQLKSPANKPADFKAAVNNNTLPGYIDSAMPQFNAVIRLRQAINKYKRIKDIPWPVLTDKFNPRLGQGHKEVKTLRHKLVTLNDLVESSISIHRLHIFDQSVIAGLKHFQQRNGIKPSGELDDTTRAALNQSLDSRIKKLQVNLWRWLSLPRTPPTKYIMVNIPAYDLSLIETGRQSLKMKVIVGKPSNQTPVMTTNVNSVTLNPTWTPTRNIINNELLPLHNSNSTLLKSRNFYLAKGYGVNTIYKEIPTNLQGMLKQYRLVQRAGNNNALGKVRFNIKNNNAIYLHDTPTRSLFKQHNRALSHGCIRLEKPNELLNTLLFNQRSHNPKRIINSQLKSKTEHVRLNEVLPVFITYQTAWIDNLGKVNWRNDLYNKDNESLQSIKTKIKQEKIANNQLVR